MTTASHDDVEPVTDRVHDNSWSANLEKDHHAESLSLVHAHAEDAIEHTEPGNHVNLVTHGAHGHPESSLFEFLDGRFGDEIDYEYVRQCGCGGHVTRVAVA